MGRPGAWRHRQRGDWTGPISHQPSLPGTWVCELLDWSKIAREEKEKKKMMTNLGTNLENVKTFGDLGKVA